MIFPIQVEFVCSELSSITEITLGNEFLMNISHLLAISPMPVKKLSSKVDLHSELTGERRRPISILNLLHLPFKHRSPRLPPATAYVEKISIAAARARIDESRSNVNGRQHSQC